MSALTRITPPVANVHSRDATLVTDPETVYVLRSPDEVRNFEKPTRPIPA